VNRAFISYAHADASVQAAALAGELARAGIRPWQDIDDLLVGRRVEGEIEEVIRKNCLGALLWLSSETGNSDFVRNIEIPRLLTRATEGGFALVPIFADMNPDEADELVGNAGVPLKSFNGVVIRAEDDVTAKIREAALKYVRAHTTLLAEAGERPPSVRAVTRVDVGERANATLDFDWREAFRYGVPDNITQLELATSLKSARDRLLEAFGPGEVEVALKTHLSVAVAIGYAFRRTTGAEPRGTHEGMNWSTTTEPGLDVPPLAVTQVDEVASPREIAIEVSISRPVSRGVEGLIAERDSPFAVRLQLEPVEGPGSNAVTSSKQLNAWAQQIVDELIRARHETGAKGASLFIAAPIPFAILLGWRLNAAGPLVVHEWLDDAGRYVPGWTIR
jgi:hypothetical protein